jgi:predicted metal-dependent HD superfamily phosphohydrolase
MNILDDSWRRGTNGRARKNEFIDLVCRYSDTQRRYHNLEHVRDMLQGLYATDLSANPTLHRAIWWHDAIYDTTRSDNEERSAELAFQTLTAWKEFPEEIAHVCALILVTKRHEIPPNDPLAQILVDLDLRILASQPEKYSFYAVNVRAEYSWVSDTDYARGRTDFLKRILARERIFTDAALDTVARGNLTRELAHWRDPSEQESYRPTQDSTT